MYGYLFYGYCRRLHTIITLIFDLPSAAVANENPQVLDCHLVVIIKVFHVMPGIKL